MKRKLVSFDWALKNLLRNKANFEILEGFFSELLLQDIKIQTILESESNKQTYDDKSNRVDMLVEADDGELILVEVQVDSEFDYFHRMLYGTCKLITDYMSAGFRYERVRKVISINIVYFGLGQGEDYVYKGVTEFKGIHKQDILGLSKTQKEKFPKISTVSDIYPLYYILKVNDFNNVAQDTLDEWIYFLKNSEIKDNFTAKGIKKAAKQLDILKLSNKKRAIFENFVKERRISDSTKETALFESRLKGRDEGKIEGKIEDACKMKQKGYPIEDIMDITGLTQAEIEKIVVAE